MNCAIPLLVLADISAGGVGAGMGHIHCWSIKAVKFETKGNELSHSSEHSMVEPSDSCWSMHYPS